MTIATIGVTADAMTVVATGAGGTAMIATATIAAEGRSATTGAAP
jgi:hypothetical protein